MRYVYIDEAGTSAHEPIAVVVGLIVDADEQWKPVRHYLDYLRDRYVPQSIKRDYVFHASDLFGGGRKAKAHLFADGHRWRVLTRLLSTPRRFGLNVAIGYADNRSVNGPRPPDIKHMFALLMCLKQANDFIQSQFPGEVATMIAEDVPPIRRHLRKVPSFFTEMRHQADSLPTLQMNEHPFDVMVDSIHFASKQEAPLLQVADACAFSLRRYFTGGSRGVELKQALLGPGKDLSIPVGGAGMRALCWPRSVSIRPHRSAMWRVTPKVHWS